MLKLRACLVGLLVITAAGCASDSKQAQAPTPLDVAPLHLGAGDRLGLQLGRTDHAIAGAEARDRALASHPDD